MEFRILGPLEVWEGDRRLPLGGAKHRALLAILILNASRVVATDRLIELLWGEEPPETVNNTLQVSVSQLRKVLEPDHVRGTPHRVLVSQEPGYLLRMSPSELDLGRFEQLREEAKRARLDGHLDVAAAALREALTLWRGPPLADLALETFAIAEVSRLKELGLQTVEDRIEADVALGRHADVIGELDALVAEHPLRERLRGQLMLALYRSGRQAEASDLFHKTRTALVEGLGMEPGPELQKLFKAILNQSPSLDVAPSLAMRDEPRINNLPFQLTSFVGRVQELGEIRRLLSESRLVTLTGAGGMGKTRLAIQVAGQLLDAYRNGVWLVELAPITEPNLIPRSVASVLGVREQPGQLLAGALADYIQSRELLLVMDNCEHVIDATARLLEPLLRTCPGLRVLATSREVLGINGEVAWRVRSMLLPDPEVETGESLIAYEAIALFVDRATAAVGLFELSDETARLVAAICQRLDGIPLAIELAAGRLRTLSLEQVADRLADRFRLLTGGSRTAMARQQTLRGAIDWSYDLLSDAHRDLFQRLSVFAGGISVEALERVGACTNVNADEVLDVLTELVARSMVIVDRDGSSARYRLLETLRQYAWEKLTESGEAHAIRDRHRDWFLELAELAEQEFRGPRQTGWFDRLELEHDNLRAALGWSLENREIDHCLRLTAALGYFWRQRGNITDGLSWLGRVLEGSAGPSKARAETLLWASALAMEFGDYSRAERFGRESVATFHEVVDPWGLGFAEHILGFVAFRQDSLDQAAELLEKSFSAFEKAGDAWGIALGFHSLGYILWARGDYARAVTVAGKALTLFRDTGDDERVASSLHLLGIVEMARGNLAAAGKLLEECLGLLPRIGAKQLMASSLYDLGVLSRCLGELERAKALQEKSLRGYADLNEKQGAAYAIAELGMIAVVEGDAPRARSMLKESLTMFRDLGDRAGTVKALGALAAAEVERRPYRAATLVGAADAIRLSVGIQLEVYEGQEYETLVASLKENLGESQYEGASAAGGSRGLDVSFGLEDEALSDQAEADLAISSATLPAPS